jgi:hypothetical protein
MNDAHNPPRWDEISYLKQGTPRQQQAFETLTALGIFDFLRIYTPVLIGTIPLDVDVETSDLDIACYAPDLALFAREVTAIYGSQPHFRLRHKQVRGVPSVVASFDYDGFEIQFFRPAAACGAPIWLPSHAGGSASACTGERVGAPCHPRTETRRHQDRTSLRYLFRSVW